MARQASFPQMPEWDALCHMPGVNSKSRLPHRLHLTLWWHTVCVVKTCKDPTVLGCTTCCCDSVGYKHGSSTVTTTLHCSAYNPSLLHVPVSRMAGEGWQSVDTAFMDPHSSLLSVRISLRMQHCVLRLKFVFKTAKRWWMATLFRSAPSEHPPAFN